MIRTQKKVGDLIPTEGVARAAYWTLFTLSVLFAWYVFAIPRGFAPLADFIPYASRTFRTYPDDILAGIGLLYSTGLLLACSFWIRRWSRTLFRCGFCLSWACFLVGVFSPHIT